MGIVRSLSGADSGLDFVSRLDVRDLHFALENRLALVIDPHLERVANVAADREDPIVDDPVIDVETRSATVDQAGALQNRKMFRDIGLTSTDHLEDVGNTTLSVVEAVQDLQASRVGHRLEDLGDPIE